MRSAARVLVPLVLSLLLATSAVPAEASSAPPDTEYNAVTGKIEVVDQVVVAGGLEVRHTTDGGPGQPDSSQLLSSDPLPDLDPRIAVGGDGSSWVVWWRDADTDVVLLRRRTMDGTWTTELPVSEPTESSRDPEIIHDGQRVFVTWLIDDGEGYDIAVRSGTGPTPWPGRSIIHRTWFRGDVNPDVHASDGRVWVTWTEDESSVGWSTWDPATDTWSAPSFEPLGSDGRDAALQRIADKVRAGS